METENKPKATRVLFGSICMDDIPAEAIVPVVTRNKDLFGNPIVKKYLNLYLYVKAEPDMYGNTHFLTCDPKKENRVENHSYIIGNMKPYEYRDHVTPDHIEAARATMSQETHVVE